MILIAALGIMLFQPSVADRPHDLSWAEHVYTCGMNILENPDYAYGCEWTDNTLGPHVVAVKWSDMWTALN